MPARGSPPAHRNRILTFRLGSTSGLRQQAVEGLLLGASLPPHRAAPTTASPPVGDLHGGYQASPPKGRCFHIRPDGEAGLDTMVRREHHRPVLTGGRTGAEQHHHGEKARAGDTPPGEPGAPRAVDTNPPTDPSTRRPGAVPSDTPEDPAQPSRRQRNPAPGNITGPARRSPRGRRPFSSRDRGHLRPFLMGNQSDPPAYPCNRYFPRPAASSRTKIAVHLRSRFGCTRRLGSPRFSHQGRGWRGLKQGE
jgi:hypothetical protein